MSEINNSNVISGTIKILRWNHFTSERIVFLPLLENPHRNEQKYYPYPLFSSSVRWNWKGEFEILIRNEWKLKVITSEWFCETRKELWSWFLSRIFNLSLEFLWVLQNYVRKEQYHVFFDWLNWACLNLIIYIGGKWKNTSNRF